MNKNLKEKVITLRKSGKSVKEIQLELNCSKSTVSYHINNVGLGGARAKRKESVKKNEYDFIKDISEDIIKKIVSMRKDNKTYKEILKEIYGISKDKLKKICRIYNIEKIKTIKDLNKEDVQKYYDEVKSLRITAKHFNTTRETLRKFINVIKKTKKNAEERKKDVVKNVIDWRKRKKIQLVQYKGGKCQNPLCGYNRCYTALDFHHINAKEKDFAISGKSYSFERLRKEVDKCVLVCRNCHSEIHEDIKQNGGISKIVEEILKENN